mmetsp:Transcript_35752/g.111195  ORF Transcript_35752/g.111195 Transcript_35752/m.111195 type:complete len:264 (-) Transcript_35752:205-996(-)
MPAPSQHRHELLGEEVRVDNEVTVMLVQKLKEVQHEDALEEELHKAWRLAVLQVEEEGHDMGAPRGVHEPQVCSLIHPLKPAPSQVDDVHDDGLAVWARCREGLLQRLRGPPVPRAHGGVDDEHLEGRAAGAVLAPALGAAADVPVAHHPDQELDKGVQPCGDVAEQPQDAVQPQQGTRILTPHVLWNAVVHTTGPHGGPRQQRYASRDDQEHREQCIGVGRVQDTATLPQQQLAHGTAECQGDEPSRDEALPVKLYTRQEEE